MMKLVGTGLFYLMVALLFASLPGGIVLAIWLDSPGWFWLSAVAFAIIWAG